MLLNYFLPRLTAASRLRAPSPALLLHFPCRRPSPMLATASPRSPSPPPSPRLQPPSPALPPPSFPRSSPTRRARCSFTSSPPSPPPPPAHSPALPPSLPALALRPAVSAPLPPRRRRRAGDLLPHSLFSLPPLLILFLLAVAPMTKKSCRGLGRRRKSLTKQAYDIGGDGGGRCSGGRGQDGRATEGRHGHAHADSLSL